MVALEEEEEADDKANQEEEYVVVSSQEVQVNAFADILERSSDLPQTVSTPSTTFFFLPSIVSRGKSLMQSHRYLRSY